MFPGKHVPRLIRRIASIRLRFPVVMCGARHTDTTPDGFRLLECERSLGHRGMHEAVITPARPVYRAGEQVIVHPVESIAWPPLLPRAAWWIQNRLRFLP